MSHYYVVLAKVAVSAIGLWAAIFVFPRFVRRVSSKADISPSYSAQFVRIVRLASILTIAIYLADSLGIAPTNIWTGLTALLGLVAVGFIAYWSALSNYVCGFVLLVSRPFAEGDEIEILELFNNSSPARGIVQELTPIYTVLRVSPEAATIFVPHNLVLQKTIKVYDKKVA